MLVNGEEQHLFMKLSTYLQTYQKLFKSIFLLLWGLRFQAMSKDQHDHLSHRKQTTNTRQFHH
jgi:hypothetical protein